jgi:hypothetical protein
VQSGALSEQDSCDFAVSNPAVKEEEKHSGLRKELPQIGESDLGQVDLSQEGQGSARRGDRTTRSNRACGKARPFDPVWQVRNTADSAPAHRRRFALLREFRNEADRGKRAPHNSLDDLFRYAGSPTCGTNNLNDVIVRHLPFHPVNSGAIPLDTAPSFVELGRRARREL